MDKGNKIAQQTQMDLRATQHDMQGVEDKTAHIKIFSVK
jgi:hypothetical protein